MTSNWKFDCYLNFSASFFRFHSSKMRVQESPSGSYSIAPRFFFGALGSLEKNVCNTLNFTSYCIVPSRPSPSFLTRLLIIWAVRVVSLNETIRVKVENLTKPHTFSMLPVDVMVGKDSKEDDESPLFNIAKISSGLTLKVFMLDLSERKSSKIKLGQTMYIVLGKTRVVILLQCDLGMGAWQPVTGWVYTNLYALRYSGSPALARLFGAAVDKVDRKSFSCMIWLWYGGSRVVHTWACVKSSCTNTHTQVWSERKKRWVR